MVEPQPSLNRFASVVSRICSTLLFTQPLARFAFNKRRLVWQSQSKWDLTTLVNLCRFFCWPQYSKIWQLTLCQKIGQVKKWIMYAHNALACTVSPLSSMSTTVQYFGAVHYSTTDKAEVFFWCILKKTISSSKTFSSNPIIGLYWRLPFPVYSNFLDIVLFHAEMLSLWRLFWSPSQHSTITGWVHLCIYTV